MWNFDVTTIPRGRTETRINEKGKPYRVYIMQSVWLANKDGKVYHTHWVPKDAKEPSIGSWAGWSESEEPIAWQNFHKPEHPGSVRAPVDPNLIPILDDVGSV